MGRGVPLAERMVRPGGVGMGRGVPLEERMARPGGVGMGRGVPLTEGTARRGGVGIGRGVPLKTATDAAAVRLLDKCLTELLTGSTIKIAARSKPDRTKMFFVMDEPSWLNHDGQ